MTRRSSKEKAHADLPSTRAHSGATKQNADMEAGLQALARLVRYRDPVSGATWCGYGRPPNWIRGKDREKFRVD